MGACLWKYVKFYIEHNFIVSFCRSILKHLMNMIINMSETLRPYILRVENYQPFFVERLCRSFNSKSVLRDI